MPTPTALLLFSGAALVLLVIPGPAVLYIVNRSVAQGRRAGMVSVAGIHVGTIVHVAAGVAGLSAIIVASATAFGIVKYAGAAYLVWLGIRALRGGGGSLEREPSKSERPLRRVFTDGVVVNVLNPKTAVFFIAFVPQFVDPAAGNVTSQLVVLGALFIVLGFLSDGAYALAAGSIGEWMGRHPGIGRHRTTASGLIYLGLGVAAAVGGGE